jgi:hypothetical protein
VGGRDDDSARRRHATTIFAMRTTVTAAVLIEEGSRGRRRKPEAEQRTGRWHGAGRVLLLSGPKRRRTDVGGRIPCGVVSVVVRSPARSGLKGETASAKEGAASVGESVDCPISPPWCERTADRGVSLPSCETALLLLLLLVGVVTRSAVRFNTVPARRHSGKSTHPEDVARAGGRIR